MTNAPKKPTRANTLARLQAASDAAVGTHTPLDAAFSAFDADAGDPAAMQAAATRLRALLAGTAGATSWPDAPSIAPQGAQAKKIGSD